MSLVNTTEYSEVGLSLTSLACTPEISFIFATADVRVSPEKVTFSVLPLAGFKVLSEVSILPNVKVIS